MRNALIALSIVLFCTTQGWPQTKLSVHWEELTAAEFQSAIDNPKEPVFYPSEFSKSMAPIYRWGLTC